MPNTCSAQSIQHRIEGVFGALALFEALQAREHQAVVRRCTAEAEAGDREHAGDFRLLEVDLLDVLHDVRGVFDRRAGRGLHDGDEVAFVLGRHERTRHRPIHPPRRTQRQHEHHRHRPFPPQGAADGSNVHIRAAVDDAVDAREETAMRMGFFVEQQRRQRGREGDGVEHGQNHRKGDRHRELLIHPPGGAGKKCDRQEHRDQHDADDDDGGEHLAHRVDRRVMRALAELAHMAFDVLNHDDRIVDHDACRENDAEERQRVDRVPEQLHERERADERHRDGDGGNQRAAPVLEEEEHHQDDEGNRFAERLQHFDNRLAHDDDVVECQLPFQARWKLTLDARHLGVDAAEHFERVRRRQQHDANARGFDAGESQPRRVVFGAQLDAADVAYAHERAVLTRVHDDVFEFAHLGQAAGRAHAELVHLVFGRGLRADRARGHLHVLFAQRIGDVARRQASSGETVRIEPQPHRKAALAKDDDVRDARHALQAVAHVSIEVIADEQRAVAVVVGVEADAGEETR